MHAVVILSSEQFEHRDINIQIIKLNFVCDYMECPLRKKKQVSEHKSVLFLVNAHLQLIFGNRCLAAVLKCDNLLLQ